MTGCASRHTFFIEPIPSNWAADQEFSRQHWKRFAPPTEAEIEGRYQLTATYYLTPQYPHASDGVALTDKAGNVLGPRISRRAFCDVADEGAVRVASSPNGKPLAYTYDGYSGEAVTDCKQIYRVKLERYAQGLEKNNWPEMVSRFETSRFHLTKAPYGNGGTTLWLVPWRTIATDNSVLPPGTLLYIPQARGLRVTLPSGETVVHDGYFFAADAGRDITENHIDIFTGMINPKGRQILRRIGGPNNPFEVYVVRNDHLIAIMMGFHQMAQGTWLYRYLTRSKHAKLIISA